jgi:hypothetical protein
MPYIMEIPPDGFDMSMFCEHFVLVRALSFTNTKESNSPAISDHIEPTQEEAPFHIELKRNSVLTKRRR